MAENEILTTCEDYLAQGDIFYYPIVATYGDRDIRILRSNDAKHGSHVMETGSACRIFSIEDLEQVLSTLPVDELRTQPFQATTDDLKEMVVVFGDLRNYFIIVSQTCDISGKDKSTQAFAAIVPYITVKDICTNDNMPFKINSKILSDTIVGQLKKRTSHDLLKKDLNQMDFPLELRDILQKWDAKGESQHIKGQIKNFLNELSQNKSSYMYYLNKNNKYNIPEGYADFTHLITVPTDQLVSLKKHRLATLNSPYREEFSNKLGDFFSRVATPQPSKGDKF